MCSSLPLFLLLRCSPNHCALQTYEPPLSLDRYDTVVARIKTDGRPWLLSFETETVVRDLYQVGFKTFSISLPFRTFAS